MVGDGGAAGLSASLSATGERIDALLDASAAAGSLARERSEELVRLVSDLYGAGLERLLTLLHDSGRLDDDLLAALADDELVSGLLLLHGLHPYDLSTRVQRALDAVRPYLGSHGGDVELLGVDQAGVVRLRLLGSCDGCPSSSATLELAVDGAVRAAAPEVSAIEVEAPARTSTGPATLIPVEALTAHLHRPADWTSVEVGELQEGVVAVRRVAGAEVALCRIGADVLAFLDRCPRCAGGFAGSVLVRRLGGGSGDAVLRCPTCAVHFDIGHGGRCLDLAELHLDPLPLLLDGARAAVAVPTAVG